MGGEPNTYTDADVDEIISDKDARIAALECIIRDFQSNMIETPGCGSHSCKVKRPTGMGTNGPCMCWQRVEPLDRERRRLRHALRIIAGYEQCADNLMSNEDVARAALAHGALHASETPTR